MIQRTLMPVSVPGGSALGVRTDVTKLDEVGAAVERATETFRGTVLQSE